MDIRVEGHKRTVTYWGDRRSIEMEITEDRIVFYTMPSESLQGWPKIKPNRSELEVWFLEDEKIRIQRKYKSRELEFDPRKIERILYDTGKLPSRRRNLLIASAIDVFAVFSGDSDPKSFCSFTINSVPDGRWKECNRAFIDEALRVLEERYGIPSEYREERIVTKSRKRDGIVFLSIVGGMFLALLLFILWLLSHIVAWIFSAFTLPPL
ncbi:hypothetical protein FUAX_05700 [Fulvitalea axinellae]|uniref:DUF4178 domain-containing protein n=1 Tax=Fulvitalea axinellae TaxID=1182444 RepID=A0AAU9CX41_9BACT|nr:hypothetical protein FUAX_05700 [Fulvitalea axinellae]